MANSKHSYHQIIKTLTTATLKSDHKKLFEQKKSGKKTHACPLISCLLESVISADVHQLEKCK